MYASSYHHPTHMTGALENLLFSDQAAQRFQRQRNQITRYLANRNAAHRFKGVAQVAGLIDLLS